MNRVRPGEIRAKQEVINDQTVMAVEQELFPDTTGRIDRKWIQCHSPPLSRPRTLNPVQPQQKDRLPRQLSG